MFQPQGKEMRMSLTKYLLFGFLLILYPTVVYAEQEKNIELYNLFKEDQSDRKGGLAFLDPYNDKLRLQQVQKLIDSNSLHHSDDFYHAAMIFQHGSKPEHFQMANKLALKSAAMNPSNTNAKWLACAAEDRYLHNVGKPQVWGTQFRMVGSWTIEPFDKVAKTDKERIENGVPTIEQTLVRLRQMNNWH